MKRVKPKLSIQYSCLSDLGKQRPANEDYWGKFPEQNDVLTGNKGQLFIVADGMGGYTRGREASETAVNTIQREYYAHPSEVIPVCLKDAFRQANSEIYKKGNTIEHPVKMGTTCSALLLSEQTAFVAHVGDSRVYKISSNKIEQITRDHSYVAEMKDKGILTPEEAKNHPRRSEINRALGVIENVKVDIGSAPLLPGDKYVLCTDGLNKVTPEEIKEIVLKYNTQLAVESLIQLANERGGEDNITVLVIYVNKKVQNGAGRKTGKKRTRSVVPFIYIVLFFMIIAAGFYFRKQVMKIINGNFQKTTTISNSQYTETGVIKQRPENHKTAGLINRAVELVKKGNYDSALLYYNKVLQRNPLHLQAISGIDRIVDLYKEKAENAGKNGDYKKALSLCRKAIDLRPNDPAIKELLNQFQQIENNKISSVSSQKEVRENIIEIQSSAEIKKTIEKTEPDSQNTKIPQWLFPGLDSKMDYRIEPSKILFLATPWPKKALYSGRYKDFIIQVNAQMNSGDLMAQYGIIIGNNSANDRFYLFTLNGNGQYFLEHRISEKVDTLFSGNHSRLSSSEPKEIRIRCVGPWIMIYLNNSLLKAWQGQSFIEGQTGLYVDANIETEFSGFRISGAFEQKN